MAPYLFVLFVIDLVSLFSMPPLTSIINLSFYKKVLHSETVRTLFRKDSEGAFVIIYFIVCCLNSHSFYSRFTSG